MFLKGWTVFLVQSAFTRKVRFVVLSLVLRLRLLQELQIMGGRLADFGAVVNNIKKFSEVAEERDASEAGKNQVVVCSASTEAPPTPSVSLLFAVAEHAESRPDGRSLEVLGGKVTAG